MTTDDKIEVMQAFVDGESIQFCIRGRGGWQDVEVPSWNWKLCDFRVKRESVLVDLDAVMQLVKGAKPPNSVTSFRCCHCIAFRTSILEALEQLETTRQLCDPKSREQGAGR